MGFSQSNESFDEQKQILRGIHFSTETFMSANYDAMVKHQLIVGQPGTGKTFLASICLTLSLSIGLSLFVTSLAARRQVNSEVNISIGFSVYQSTTTSRSKMAELDIQIKREFFLMQLQTLLVEEVGLISTPQWAAMDLI